MSGLSSPMSGHVELCRDCRLDIHPDTHVGLCRGVEAMSGSCRVMSSRGSGLTFIVGRRLELKLKLKFEDSFFVP